MKCTMSNCKNDAVILGIDPNPTDIAAACEDHLWIFTNNDGDYEIHKRYNLIGSKTIVLETNDIISNDVPENRELEECIFLHGIKENIIIYKNDVPWYKDLFHLIPRYVCIDGHKRLMICEILNITYITCTLLDFIPTINLLKQYDKMRGRNAET